MHGRDACITAVWHGRAHSNYSGSAAHCLFAASHTHNTISVTKRDSKLTQLETYTIRFRARVRGGVRDKGYQAVAPGNKYAGWFIVTRSG